ncbi:MAG: hypothetical protein CVU65_12405 [Deltaproteobacteria bacterium HGW-Deltaproteobacteria-22]|nr:MAG: hypothetical protein CVU65_12405 [Deltaproteobacteria bacterium HGW-Deltaproteobacteria-22]
MGHDIEIILATIADGKRTISRVLNQHGRITCYKLTIQITIEPQIYHLFVGFLLDLTDIAQIQFILLYPTRVKYHFFLVIVRWMHEAWRDQGIGVSTYQPNVKGRRKTKTGRTAPSFVTFFLPATAVPLIFTIIFRFI